MSALQTAVEEAKGQAALADAIGVKQQHVWNWLNRQGAKVPPEHCASIERVTNVKRWDLRPDDWYRIWPELVGTKGAPRVPAQPKAA